MESLKLFCSSQPSDHLTLRAWESRDRVDVTVAEDGSSRGIAASRSDARKMRDWLTEWLGDAPVVNWQPIEPENIKPGMEVRRGRKFRDALEIITLTVARLSDSAVYSAEGAVAPTINPNDRWFVNPATIPDPDAELIDALRGASWLIENSGERPDPLPGLPEARDLLNKLRELGWTVIRESEATA